MSARPQMMPPPDGDANHGPALLALDWTMCSICIVMITARFYVRMAKRTVGADDWCMLIATILFVATNAVITKEIYYGLGRHGFYIPPQNQSPFLYWVFILQSFTFLTLAFAKTSISLLLLRLLSPQSLWRRRLLWLNIVLFFIVSVLSTILNLASCRPIQMNWNPQIPGGSCWSLKVNADWAIFVSAYSVFLDFFLALLPISIVYNLQMSLKKKISLCILLGLGCLSGIAAAIKTSETMRLNSRSDFTFDAVPLYAWSETEFFLNLFCGSATTLKPLYDRFLEGTPLTPKESAGYDGSGSKFRRVLFGHSMSSDRFRLRDVPKKSTRSKPNENEQWGLSSNKSITVQQSFDVETASKDSSQPINRRDMV